MQASLDRKLSADLQGHSHCCHIFSCKQNTFFLRLDWPFFVLYLFDFKNVTENWDQCHPLIIEHFTVWKCLLSIIVTTHISFNVASDSTFMTNSNETLYTQAIQIIRCACVEYTIYIGYRYLTLMRNSKCFWTFPYWSLLFHMKFFFL